MSIYTSDVVKPGTLIFSQQPKDIYGDFRGDGNHNADCNGKIATSKPVAYVSPIEQSSMRDAAIQTDSISIDINSIINIYDFHRSERLVGKLDAASIADSITSCERLAADNRVESLENELRQQLTINDDIKKLLIASLGDDLAAHLVKLTSDVASFNELVAKLMSDKRDSTESIDKLSIEADLWKNKFVAGRVLVDELAGWKHQFSLRYKESLGAVHCLLQERQTLRQLLTMTSNELLNLAAHINHKPPLISISNTVDLTKYNLTLLRTIINTISTGPAWHNQMGMNDECVLNFTGFTEGEELALQVLGNQPNPYADNTARITTSFVSENAQCMATIADKLCKNCKGEIFVI